MEKALQVKSQFLAIMSHEIRTPLTGILSSITLLTDTDLTEDQRQLLRIGQVSGEQLLVMINDVLGIFLEFSLK